MITIGLVLAGLAALLHVYIFYLESIAWMSKRVRATFGISRDQAAATKEMAFNQGFYNMFLAIIAGAGIVLYFVAQPAVGLALVFAGVGSMLAAALVLLLRSPKMWKAAVTQGVLPLLGVGFLIIELVR